MQTGERVGDYELFEELGRGGAGVVFRARRRNGDDVALKLVASDGPDGRDTRNRFLREARATASLEHPNIARVFGMFFHEGHACTAVELVRGPSLRVQLTRSGSLPPRAALVIVEKLARALQYVHERGIIHRDVKPENILMAARDEPKLVDFGIAKDVRGQATRLSLTGTLIGSPLYVSPEQARGEINTLDDRTDVWSLGVVLYELLSGETPFAAPKLRDLLIQIGEVMPPAPRTPDGGSTGRAGEIALWALSKDREQRPRARALAEACAAAREALVTAPSLLALAPRTEGPPRTGLGRIGAYELESEIGRGGGGTVYRGRAPDGGAVAIKVLSNANGPEVRERFLREIRLLGAVGDVQGFVPYLDAGDSPRGPFLVMPLVPGGNLRDLLLQGPAGFDETIELGARLARALAVAHARGIIHRDLKPENILFPLQGSRIGDSGPPLIADLGVAKHFRRDVPGASASVTLSTPGFARGTLGYMPREQMADAASVTPAADVFAVGAILYECLAGRAAFEGDSPINAACKIEKHELVPLVTYRADTPAWLVKVIEQALADDPGQRFVDGSDLARALEREVPGRPVRPPRRRLLVVASLLGSVLLAATSLVLLVRRDHAVPGVLSSPLPSSSPRPRPTKSARPQPSPSPTPLAVRESPSPSPVATISLDQAVLLPLPSPDLAGSPALPGVQVYASARAADASRPTPASRARVADLARGLLELDPLLPERYVARALERRRSGDGPGANEDLALARDLLLAKAERDEAQPLEAWRDWTELLTFVDGASGPFLESRARVELSPQLQWFDLARKDLEASLASGEIADDVFLARCILLGDLYAGMGFPKEALPVVDGLLGRRKTHAMLCARLGILLGRNGPGDLEREAETLKAALEAASTDVLRGRDYLSLGEVHLRQGAVEEAEADLTRAIALSDDTGFTKHRYRVETRLKLERWKDALEDLDFLLERAPRDLGLLVLRMETRGRVHDTARAIEDAHRILEIDPNSPEAGNARIAIDMAAPPH